LRVNLIGPAQIAANTLGDIFGQLRCRSRAELASRPLPFFPPADSRSGTKHWFKEASAMQGRLGEVLVQSGVLSQEQVEQVLMKQSECGKPFGLLCERMFSIAPSQIEDAWASQYAGLTRTINPATESFDPQALSLITRRQSWQFRVLPIRFDEGELMLATTEQHLRRGLRFATNVITVPVYLVIAAPDALGQALCKHYPLPGMTAKSVAGNDFERLALAASTAPRAKRMSA
jgi:hypothetical protein